MSNFALMWGVRFWCSKTNIWCWKSNIRPYMSILFCRRQILTFRSKMFNFYCRHKEMTPNVKYCCQASNFDLRHPIGLVLRTKLSFHKYAEVAKMWTLICWLAKSHDDDDVLVSIPRPMLMAFDKTRLFCKILFT